MALTKKVYTKTKKVIIYGSGSFISFFLILLSLSYLGIQVETSGDQVCGVKCISYFNITLTNYSLCFGSTFKGLTTEPNVITEIYKADLRYSNSNPARWNLYNFTANKCLAKNTKHEFKIIGYKNVNQTVKWGLDLQGKNVDPYWYSSQTQNIYLDIFKPNPELASFSVEKTTEGIKISHKDYSVTFVPYFIMQSGTVYTWQDIPNSIQKNLWKEQIQLNKYKYGADFSNISTNIKNNLNYVVLHRVNSTGLTWDDVQLQENTIIIKNKVYISHNDILSTYTIPIINKTDIVIGNLASNFVDNGDGTWNISFDPTITITEAQAVIDAVLINVTAETGERNFTHLNITTTAPYNNLVAYWNFDGDRTNIVSFKAYDWTNNNYDGTAVGTAVVNSTNCIYGNCVQLDGNSDYVEANNGLITGYPYTMTAWVRARTTGLVQVIVRVTDKDDSVYGSGLEVNGSGSFGARVRNSTQGNVFTGATSPAISNTWYFVAGVFINRTRTELYIDGTLNATSSGTVDYNPAMDRWDIGRAGDSTPDSYFNGTIDEVMIFNTNLTAAQILSIYQNQSSRFSVQGTQTLANQSYLNISSGNNRVNVTTTFQSLLGSLVNLSIGYYNASGWFDTSPQNLTNGTIHIFNISDASTNLTLNYTLIAGNSTNPFYSPIIYGIINITTWNEAAVTDIEYPQFSSYWDDNATLIGSGNGKFNVTVANTNGTVILHISNQDITATNLTTNVYNASYDFTSSGNYLYNWTAYGNGTLHNLNTSENRYYTVNASADIEYPQFSNFWSNNFTLISNGTGLFNTTVISTNGTVWLEIGGTNITAQNVTANVYNASYYFSGAGAYIYRWHSWGNGSLHNYNKSLDKVYNVNATCTTLNIPNSVYTLERNITNTGICMNFTTQNITLDCNGYEINYSSGDFGYGVYSNQYNSTVKNCIIKEGRTTTNYKRAIFFNGANNGNILSNNITVLGEQSHAIYMANSNNTNITGNWMLANANSGDDSYSVMLDTSTNNFLSNNIANSSNMACYAIYGTKSQDFNHTIGTSNLAKGSPVNFTYNAENLVYNSLDYTPYGQVIFAWSRNLTISNSNFSGDSLNLFSTNSSTISNNNMTTSVGFGIYLLTYSNYNIITNNIVTTLTNPEHYVIHSDLYSSNNNITNNIITSTGSLSHGIRLEATSGNNYIFNNTINIAGANSFGLKFSNSNNNIVNNNNITTSGNTAYGMYLQTTTDNQFNNNLISTSNTNANGINLITQSNNNIFINTTIKNTGTTGYGVQMEAISLNNTFSNANINTKSYALRLYALTNTFSFTDSILNSSTLADILLRSSVTGGSFNFTNVTRADGTPINISWSAGANGTLNMHWYLDINVSDNSTRIPLQNANITSYNVSGTLVNSTLTDANGLTRQTLLEYTNWNNTVINYFTPHTINTTYTNYLTNSTVINLSATLNTNLNILLRTCAYNSGNWNIRCDDVCTISDNYNLNNNNITFTGSGYFILNANITNANRKTINTGCRIIINSGCKF
jgi:hypothetical protein